MRRTTARLTDMQSLSLLVLLVAAASAVDIVKKDDKISYRCALRPSEHSIILKERKFPIYLCKSDDGDQLIFASETFHDDKLDVILDKDTVLKLRDIIVRPKRQLGFGNFAGSNANAQSSAGSFGGGGGVPFYGGGPGYGGGGSFSSATSNAGSFGLGGGGFGK